MIKGLMGRSRPRSGALIRLTKSWIALLALLPPLSSVLGASDWHHPLSVSGGGYWRQRIRVEISNLSSRNLAGKPLTLQVGSDPGKVDLTGAESQSIRVVDNLGTELLFALSGPDGKTIRRGTIPEGSSLTIPVECRPHGSALYWIYFANPMAWQVPDFLHPPGLANGGMEEGSGNSPSWWKHDSGDFDHQANWVEEAPYSGQKCLKLHVTLGAPESWISTRQKHIPIEGGRIYTLRGWVRAQNVSAGSLTGWYIHVATEENPLAINRGLSAGAGTYGWSRVSWTFTAPPEAVEASVGTMLWGSGTAWFDAVTLEAQVVEGPGDLHIATSLPESLSLAEIGVDAPWFGEDSEDDLQWQFRVPLQLLNVGPEPLKVSAAVNVRRYTPRWRNLNPDSFRVVIDAAPVTLVSSGEELFFDAWLPSQTRRHCYLYFSTDPSLPFAADGTESAVNGSNNPVFNPSFEQVTGAQPTGWNFQDTASTISYGSAFPGLLGDLCATFTVPHTAAGSVGWPGWIQNVPVEPGKSYLYSGSVKLDDVRGTVRIHAHLRDRNGKLVGGSPFLSIGTGLTGTTDWTQLSGTFTIPPGATIFQIHLTMNATGTLSHDGILLLPLEKLTHPVQGPVEARETPGQTQVWSVPAVAKVFRDDHPPLKPQPAEIAASGGEFEPLQLAIRSQKASSRVRVEVDSPRRNLGTALDSFGISVVGFVPVAYTSDYHDDSGRRPWERPVVIEKPAESGLLPSDFGPGSDGWVGWWPDPLLPIKEFPLLPNHTQPIWVTFWIPPGTPAGDYSGKVRFVQDQSTLAETAFRLHVWNFSLPVDRDFTAIYDVRSGFLSEIPGQAPEVTYQKLLELMADHRISPDRILPEPLFTFDNGSVAADYEKFDQAAAFFLDTLGVPQLYAPSVFYLFGWANPPVARFGEAPYPGPYPYQDADRSELRSKFKEAYQTVLDDFWGHLEEKGWDQHFVLYISDEPHYWEKGIIEQMQALCDMVHEVNPAIPIYSSVWGHVPDWDGYLDVWGIGHYGIVPAEEMEQLISAGDRLWFTTDGQMCIDTPYCAIERLLPHMAFHYGVEGYEFWASTGSAVTIPGSLGGTPR